MTQRLTILLFTVLLSACGSSRTVSDGGGTDSGRDAGPTDGGPTDSGPVDAGFDASRPDAGMCMDPPPDPSRPVAWTCSDCRPPGPDDIMSGDCTSDADCTEGDNGRCGFSRIGGSCSYDECFEDADCPADQLCACDGGFGGGNACIEARCHTDADCGGFACSPSLGDCGHYFPPVGYFCHSERDSCSSDRECGDGYCAFDPTTNAWACSNSECVG